MLCGYVVVGSTIFTHHKLSFPPSKVIRIHTPFSCARGGGGHETNTTDQAKVTPKIAQKLDDECNTAVRTTHT